MGFYSLFSPYSFLIFPQAISQVTNLSPPHEYPKCLDDNMPIYKHTPTKNLKPMYYRNKKEHTPFCLKLMAHSYFRISKNHHLNMLAMIPTNHHWLVV